MFSIKIIPYTPVQTTSRHFTWYLSGHRIWYVLFLDRRIIPIRYRRVSPLHDLNCEYDDCYADHLRLLRITEKCQQVDFGFCAIILPFYLT